jgi:hypothetical protein
MLATDPARVFWKTHEKHSSDPSRAGEVRPDVKPGVAPGNPPFSAQLPEPPGRGGALVARLIRHFDLV